jgi:ribosome-associated heat shock protein Hsp15
MSEEKSIRIDKFLWSVRIYKTRSIASDACNKGRIIVNNIQAKPSRIISKNDIIQVKKPPVLFIYKVLEPVDKRISAKLVEQYVEDMTTDEEKAKINIRHRVGIVFREKGSGRPTKKERRVIDRIQDDLNQN